MSAPKPQADRGRATLRRRDEQLRCTVCLTNRGQARYIAPVCHHVEIAGKEAPISMAGSLLVVMLGFDVAWARKAGPGKQRRRIA